MFLNKRYSYKKSTLHLRKKTRLQSFEKTQMEAPTVTFKTFQLRVFCLLFYGKKVKANRGLSDKEQAKTAINIRVDLLRLLV